MEVSKTNQAENQKKKGAPEQPTQNKEVDKSEKCTFSLGVKLGEPVSSTGKKGGHTLKPGSTKQDQKGHALNQLLQNTTG